MNRAYRVLLFVIVIIFPLPGYCFTDHQSSFANLIPRGALKNGKLGVYVKSVKSDLVIFHHNGSKNFIPASNNKLITSYAALSLLRKNYRFKTEFYSRSGIHKGVIDGGLYVKAYGNPSITTNDLADIAKKMRSMGLKQIKGNLYLDGTYFDDVQYAHGWKVEWKGSYYCPPIDAFVLNYNTVKVVVIPSRPGNMPSVKIVPEHYKLNINNKAVTTERLKSKLSVDIDPDGKVINVNGTINYRDEEKATDVSVLDPEEYFGLVLKRLFIAEGIEFEGNIYAKKVPESYDAFYVHHSDPLWEIISEFNKDSVNIIGESLVKILGAEYTGKTGTWKRGSAVIRKFMQEQGIGGNMEISDGSGLSFANKVSPKVLAEILSRTYSESDFFYEFLSSLPAAGIDGTLKKRFRNSLIEGRVVAKTGYLKNIRALSGYVFARSGNILVFSILSDGLDDEVKDFQEDLLVKLLDCCNW